MLSQALLKKNYKGGIFNLSLFGTNTLTHRLK